MIEYFPPKIIFKINVCLNKKKKISMIRLDRLCNNHNSSIYNLK